MKCLRKFLNILKEMQKKKKLKNIKQKFKSIKENKLRADGSFNLMSNGVQHKLI